MAMMPPAPGMFWWMKVGIAGQDLGHLRRDQPREHVVVGGGRRRDDHPDLLAAIEVGHRLLAVRASLPAISSRPAALIAMVEFDPSISPRFCSDLVCGRTATLAFEIPRLEPGRSAPPGHQRRTRRRIEHSFRPGLEAMRRQHILGRAVRGRYPGTPARRRAAGHRPRARDGRRRSCQNRHRGKAG